MKEILKGRMTVDNDKSFTLFIVGMRVNRVWKVNAWFSVFVSMMKIMYKTKKLGFSKAGLCGGEHLLLGNPTLFVQYWKDHDALVEFARNPEMPHIAEWSKYKRKYGDSQDVGIYHETYDVKPKTYEGIYLNMPKFGLGRIFDLVEVSKNRSSSKNRMVVSEVEAARDA